MVTSPILMRGFRIPFSHARKVKSDKTMTVQKQNCTHKTVNETCNVLVS